MVEVVAERAPRRFGVDPIREVQVLAPMYRGAVGIDALNERLQASSTRDGKPALNERFRLGDRLIQTRNSHELGLMNGSIVFLREDDPGEEEIVVDTDDGEVPDQSPTATRRRCASPTRSPSTRPRAARFRWSSASATAPTRGC